MNIKSFLYALGPHLGLKLRRKLISTVGALEFGTWLQTQGYTQTPQFKNREQLFEIIGKELQNEPVLYMEFGVWKADATRKWVELLRHPDTVFHGFDTFEGLPEAWGNEESGRYTNDGKIPQINDIRVKFFKGLFQETLSTY